MRPIDADVLKERFYGSERAKYTGTTIVHAIESMPAIEAEPVRHGRWIDAREHCGTFVCSRCEHQSVSLYDYCPGCGAKMDGGTDK